MALRQPRTFTFDLVRGVIFMIGWQYYSFDMGVWRKFGRAWD